MKRIVAVLLSVLWLALSLPGSNAVKFRFVTEFEEEAIARLVAAEVPDAPLAVKTALAALVLNRLEDVRYPSSVIGVILEEGQFRSVADGSYFRVSPDALGEALGAVRAAEAGFDPSGGSLVYSPSDDGSVKFPRLIADGAVFGCDSPKAVG